MASGFGPGGFRARRGMIEPAILAALLDRPMHGYEIMDSIEERTQGMWRPSAGSVYPTLQLLEEKELVVVKTEGEKKVYHLTDAGKTEAEQAKSQQDHLRAAWTGRRDEAMHMREIHAEMHEIGRLMRQFRKHRTAEKTDKLLEMMRAFKHNLIELIEE
jgi:DNA-binding PadR family transcriptional regulator